jgi:hypothetical protein
MQKLNSYAEVQAFINGVLQADSELDGVPLAPHKGFWTTLSYVDFTTGNVPNIVPPTKILVKGDSANSALISVLNGTNATFPQMPFNGPPFFTDDQIASISDWIDRGCPQ